MIRARAIPAVAVLALAVTAAHAPAAVASGEACPSLDDGVTVVVDFQHLGGGAVVRCAPGDPDSGLAALAAAGFRVDQIADQPGFVCRIDGLPGPEAEDCADTPPAKAYWGYSHAERGGDWSYAGSGAHVYDPPVGGVEGWAFNGEGGSTQPTIPPPPAPEPEPSPSPSPSRTASAPTAPAPPDEDEEVAVAGRTTTEPPEDPTATPSGRASTPAAEGAASPPAATAMAEAPTTPIDDAAPTTTAGATPRAAAATSSAPGTPWATIAGVALITALLAGGAVARARRERDGAPPTGDAP